MKRVCLLGCGRLGRIIADALLEGAVSGAELTAVCTRSPEKARQLAMQLHRPVVTSAEALMAYRPDYVIEAATADTVKACAVQILSGGADFIVLSTSALGDSQFRREMEQLAEKTDRHIYLAHGVIGGLDVVEAAAMMGTVSAALTKRKFPVGSRHSDAALDSLADDFSGTAEDALRLYPNLLNIGVSLGLALDDLAAAQVRVEPSDCVDFTVTCTGEFGAGSFHTELGPAGPALAAWSTLVMLKRLTRRITF